MLTVDKPCSKCGKNLRHVSRGGCVHSWCRRCQAKDQAKRRKEQPEHVENIRKISAKKRIGNNVQRVRALKDKPCTDCGHTYPHYVMQFDHRDPSNKRMAIATLCRNTVAWKHVEEEIAKCDLVCANCHAVRTWNRRRAK